MSPSDDMSYKTVSVDRSKLDEGGGPQDDIGEVLLVRDQKPISGPGVASCQQKAMGHAYN